MTAPTRPMIEVANFSPFQRQIPMMHEAKGMMAMEGPRASLTPLQPVPQEMHTSVIRKTYDSSLAVPVSAIETPDDQNNRYTEHMDEDEFSDHDSHYSEDFVDDIDDDDEEEETVPKPPDMTKQLLDFADMANADIKKFFGRRKDEEDYCDIYENKWNVTKSGRELYYADLMKIVHGEDKGRKYSSASSASPPLLDISNSNPAKQPQDNRNLFSGKQDKKIGLGPLEELFDVGLRNVLPLDRKNKLKEPKRFKVDDKKIESVTLMRARKLPSSFWHEPGRQSSDLRRNGGTSVIHSNNPPDFSDLLDSWRLDRHDFSGDVSSSDVSLSPESGMDHT